MEALLERIQGRSFQTSCEAELQELMKQIDIMVAHKKTEWETQTRALESCLDVREQELSSLRNALDEKCKEIERLCQRLEGMEQLNRDMTMEYEQQLRKVQEELARLKRSYEKLLKKQLKEARKLPSRSQEEDQSEVSILTKKLEEFRQKSLDWEKQRLHYQQHVASLEAQRKAFSEQSDLIQAQLSSRKQMFESVELASQSEIHHLTSKLERANDTICANELEVERLNMKVDDLTSSNQKILEEHQRVLDELKVSRNSLEVLHEEKMELRATLLSQEDFINNLQMHKEQLQKEVSKLTETLQNKEAFVRSLEECLQSSEGANGIYRSRTELDNIHLHLDHPEIIHLEGSLSSANANHAPPSELLTEKCQELQLTEEHLCQAKAEIKKAVLSQLESLKQDNHQLSEILQKGKSAPLAEFQESYTKALNKVESENQRLLKELAETKASLEASSRRSQGRYENIMQQMQQQMTEIKNVESRRLQELQCKHEEEMRVLQDKFDKTVQHYEEEIQKVQHLSTRRVFSTADGLSPQISRSNSVESLSCDPLLRSDSLPHGNSEFTYMFGKNEKELLSLSPLPTTNIGAIAVKFLEEEEERSQHILERLDAHIEELKKESEMTIQQFKHQK
ncbi:centrosomal protein of 63 kDa isoform X5 [Podarcis muralis]